MSTTPPASLGRYVIEGALGRGAMGLVFKAHDPRLGRPVALKTLAPGLLAGEKAQLLKERFLNEGRAAGRLRHRAIVAVYDADEDPATGTAYLAMEFIEGTDLRARLKQGLSVPALVDVLAEVADALQHAHERGVVHRDVKPANVLLDAQGRPHLTDFGIARLGDSTLTQDGEFLGTPAYMAPEQVRARPVSPQTDIYALGVILYEGLTGRRPFEGDSMVATATAIATDQPVPPSHAGFTSTAFDPVIARALSKEPEQRQATAGEFAAEMLRALHETQSGAPARARAATPAAPTAVAAAPSAPARAEAPPKKKGGRGIAIGLTLVGLAIVVGVVLMLKGRSAPPDEPAAASAAGATAPAKAPAQPTAAHATAAPRASTPSPTAASATTARVVDPARRPAASGTLGVECTSPKLGTLTVRDGGREVGRIPVQGKRRGLKVMQVDVEGSFPLPAGERTLTFVFTPDDGKTLSADIAIDLAPGARVTVLVDVGTFGRNLQVKLKP